MSDIKSLDTKLTISKLMELQESYGAGTLPLDWMSEATIAQLARDAADLLERYKSLNELSNRDMAIICKALVEARKELEGYTHGVTDDSYDSSKLDAVIILLDSHLF